METFETILGIMLGLVATSPIIIWVLAKFDICFTFKVEGKTKAVVHGKVPVDFLFSWSGYKMLKTKEAVDNYNKTRRGRKAILWDIVPLEGNEATVKAGSLIRRCFDWACNQMGIQWIGLWPFYQIYWYTLRCSTIERSETGEITEKFHPEQSCFVYQEGATYFSRIPLCVNHPEENINLTIDYLFSLSCTNPYVALFKQSEWFINLTALTDAKATRFIAGKKYEEINIDSNINNATDDDDFAQWMLAIKDDIRSKIGFDFNGVIILRKLPFDDQAKAFIASIPKAKIAEREGEARVMEATKNALVAAQKAIGEQAHYGAKTTAVGTLVTDITANVDTASKSLDGKSIQTAIGAVLIPLATALLGQLLTKDGGQNNA